MVLIQPGKDTFHDGLPVQSRLGGNLELTAIFVYGGEFLVIQIDDLPVGAFQGSSLLVEEIRRHCRQFLVLTFQGYGCIGQTDTNITII